MNPLIKKRSATGLLSSFAQHTAKLLFVLLAATTAWADEPDPPSEKAILALLEKHCAECHGPDDEIPELHNAIKLADLLADTDYVTPGEPDDSDLFVRVDLPEGNRKRMPKSKGKPGDKGYRAPLTDAEKTTLRQWIQGDAPAPPPPATLTPDQQVLSLFEASCATCHTDDNLPDLHGGINLAELLQDDEFITPGNPTDSLLYKTVIRDPDSRSRMPKNVKKAGQPGYIPPLTETEKRLLHDWIARAEAPATRSRTPVNHRDTLRLIAADLDTLQPATARKARYLSLANLYSLRKPNGTYAENDAQMNIYRAALGKLVNSLSTGPAVVPLTPVDPAQTLYRLDLRDYAITPATWETIVRGYPYGLTRIDGPAENAIREATDSARAYLRGDWFVFACSQAPLYHDILHLPANDRQLERQLGIDVPANLQNYEAIRAGFRNSGVSQANRMVERHEIEAYRGAYWKSYDFSPDNADARDDLFNAPLGPLSAGLTRNPRMAFTHDGGEIIYHLPNGLQAYLLSTADGTRLNRAPIEIVQDEKRKDGIILNGISCIACHSAGMKFPPRKTLAEFRDEVGPIALAGAATRRDRLTIQELYTDPHTLQRLTRLDQNRFLTALGQAIPDYVEGQEPVSVLYNRFKAPVHLDTLGAELDLAPERLTRFLSALRRHHNPQLAVLGAQLEAGMPIPRQLFHSSYRDLAHELRFDLLPHTPIPYEEFGGDASAEAGTPPQTEPVAASPAVAPPAVAIPHATTTDAPSRPLHASTRFGRDGLLTLTLDQDIVTIGDPVNVDLHVTRAASVRVLHFGADGSQTQLFPNEHQPNSRLRGGQRLRILQGVVDPATGREFRWHAQPPAGPESIVAFATDGDFTDDPAARAAALRDGLPDVTRAVYARGKPAIRAVVEGARPANTGQARVNYLLVR